jgi:hypothetical protein
MVSLTWVTIAWAGQGPVDNNASMVLGLDSYVGYELTPRLDRVWPQ